MIDYSRIKDPEYFKSLIDDINEITELRTVTDILKTLSIKIARHEIDPIDANLLVGAAKNRYKALTDSYKHKIQENEQAERKWAKDNGYDLDRFPTSNVEWEGGGTTKNGATNNQEKKLTLSPTSVSGRTGRRGTISIVLIIASVAVTTAMYTLLWIAQITK